MVPPVDSSILHEIVRVIEARAKVPERVRIKGKEYLITYLDDHRQRLEEAIRRHDSDRISMLYGQLASKMKYQLLRARSTAATASGQKRPAAAKKPSTARKHHPASKKLPAGKRRSTSRAARG